VSYISAANRQPEDGKGREVTRLGVRLEMILFTSWHDAGRENPTEDLLRSISVSVTPNRFLDDWYKF
jgi:hypothetical protein